MIWYIIIILVLIILQFHNQYRVNKILKHFDDAVDVSQSELARYETMVALLYEMNTSNNKEEVSCPLTYDEFLDEENSIK